MELLEAYIKKVAYHYTYNFVNNLNLPVEHKTMSLAKLKEMTVMRKKW